jgi:drug/metabolite transporter (DMT)-like permease
MNEQPMFWFGAKRYGLGWGLPVCWQGWVVLGGYFALLFGGIYYFATTNASALLAYIVLLTVALVAVIAAKGERPVRWRWGGE